MKSSLLDRYIPSTAAFRPTVASELFALRLAQKLVDAPAVRHYASLVDSYSQGQLLCAYRRALRSPGNESLGRRFHVELERIHSNGNHDRHGNLISIRIERRTVAAAIFYGEHLEYADSRQLSSVRDKALSSAVGFVTWILGRFQFESAALESIPNGHEILRRVLHDGICQTLRSHALPLWEIPKTVLFEGYGQPPVKSRAELREIATAIWPVIAGTHAKVFQQDAAVLGLHVQTERFFIIN
jgi:hypothetical protein